MHKYFLVLLVVLAGVLRAADDPSLSFPDQKIEAPPLSLPDKFKFKGPLDDLNSAGNWIHAMPQLPTAPKNRVSQMSVMVPSGDIDKAMIKAPDTSKDYKLIVKAPAVLPVK